MLSLSNPLITWTSQGLFCPDGGFYIDPSRAVDVAIISHAHSDHARRGSRKYICEKTGIGLLKARLGGKIQVQGFAYGEAFRIGEVQVSLHSAGHILGSSQIRVQRGSEVWVVSGDYKRAQDPSCQPFESVACDTFITEATFGTPKYIWDENLRHGEAISRWWKECSSLGHCCVLFAYSLGKAQRILAELEPYCTRPVLIYSTITELTECYRQAGIKLAPTLDLLTAIEEASVQGKTLQGELILAPPGVLTKLQEEKPQVLGNVKTAFASGWMLGATNSGYGFRSHCDHGFVISDHADWNDINRTIEETGARRVFVQHRNGALIRHLRKKGFDAHFVEALSSKDSNRFQQQALGVEVSANLDLFLDQA